MLFIRKMRAIGRLHKINHQNPEARLAHNRKQAARLTGTKKFS